MSFPANIPTPHEPVPQLPYPPQAYEQRPATNVLAIISLISAFVFSAAAVVTGHIALSQIKRTGETGRGLALAGLIIGYVGVAGMIVLTIVWVLLTIAMMSHGPAPHPGYRYGS